MSTTDEAFDPLPDLARLLSANIHDDAIPPAYRLARKLRISPGAGPARVEEILRAAIAAAQVPAGSRS